MEPSDQTNPNKLTVFEMRKQCDILIEEKKHYNDQLRKTPEYRALQSCAESKALRATNKQLNELMNNIKLKRRLKKKQPTIAQTVRGIAHSINMTKPSTTGSEIAGLDPQKKKPVHELIRRRLLIEQKKAGVNSKQIQEAAHKLSMSSISLKEAVTRFTKAVENIKKVKGPPTPKWKLNKFPHLKDLSNRVDIDSFKDPTKKEVI